MFNPWKILGWKISLLFFGLVIVDRVLWYFVIFDEHLLDQVLYGLLIVYAMSAITVRQIKYNKEKKLNKRKNSEI